MANTIYAAFNDASLAEKAAGALLDHGVRSEDISVIRSHDGQMSGMSGTTTTAYGRTDGDNDLKNAGDAALGGTKSVGNRIAEYGDRAAGAVADAVGADRAAAGYRAAAERRDDLADANATAAKNEFNNSIDNPSYSSGTRMSTGSYSDGDNDLKNAGDAAVGGISSVGNRAAELGDRAAGGIADALGAEGTAANFRSAANERDMKADMDAANAGRELKDSVDMPANRPSDYVGTQTMGTGIDNPGGSMGGAALNDISRSDNVGYGTTYDRVDNVNGTSGDTEAAAKHGISTTTAADAGSGAITGTAVGVGLGALAALASLFVPGVGLVLGGGALAAALGGVAASAGAGAVAGGVTGYLKDQGVDEHIASDYHSTIEGGGALISVHVPSGNVDESKVREILGKYGAANVNAYAARGYMA